MRGLYISYIYDYVDEDVYIYINMCFFERKIYWNAYPKRIDFSSISMQISKCCASEMSNPTVE